MNICKACLSVVSIGILAALAGCGSSSNNTSLSPFFAPFATATPTPLARTLVAANSDANTITSYDANSSGNLNPLSSIGLTQLVNPNAMAVDTVHNEIFVSNGGKTVTVYSRTASGSVAPSRVLYLPAGESNNQEHMAVDPVNNELIVAIGDTVAGPAAILVYSRTASGTATPLRTITGTATLFSSVQDVGVTVDTVNNEILVNNAVQILVFSRTATGNVAPLRSISGSNTGLTGAGQTDITVDPVNNEILVTSGQNVGSPAILAFSRTATGNVSPLRSISGSNTGLTTNLFDIAVDTVNNELAVTDQGGTVEVFSRTAGGNVAPLRTLSGTVKSPSGLFVDTTNNELGVTDNQTNSVDVFSRTANGNASPLRTIADTHTGLNSPGSVALDIVDGLIAVGNAGSDYSGGPGTAAVYKSTANGDVAPLNSVVVEGLSANTGLFDGLSESVAIDPVNKELVVANYAGDASDGIVVFSLSANGTATPLRTIAGSNTGLFAPEGVYVDPVNNEIGVFNDTVGTATITIYSRTANGNIAPLRTISVPANNLGGGFMGVNFSARSLAIDPVNNEILLSGGSDNNIQVFSRTATGTATPLRTISGSSTGLDIASGVAVDPVENEIFVSNIDLANPTNSIEVFSRTANGNVSPLRTISGSSTNLTNPTAIAVSP